MILQYANEYSVQAFRLSKNDNKWVPVKSMPGPMGLHGTGIVVHAPGVALLCGGFEGVDMKSACIT